VTSSEHGQWRPPDLTDEQIREAAAYVRSLIKKPARPTDPRQPAGQADTLARARARIDRDRTNSLATQEDQ
jgi:hypothetical protein